MYAQVIIPLNLDAEFTYRVPDALQEEIQVGKRCVVSFGKKRFYVGIVASLSTEEPPQVATYNIKSLLSIIDAAPLVTKEEISMWQWAASYYITSLGSMLSASLPSSLIPQSNTEVYIHFDRAVENEQITSEEYQALATIKHYSGSKEKMTFDKLMQLLPAHHKFKLFSSLVDKELLDVEEKLHPFSKPLGTAHISLSSTYQTEEAIEQLLETYKRRKSQTALLIKLLSLLDATSEGYQGAIAEATLVGNDGNRKNILRKLIEASIVERQWITITDKNTPLLYRKKQLPNLSTSIPNYYKAYTFEEEWDRIGVYCSHYLSQEKNVLLLFPQSSSLEATPHYFCELLKLPSSTPLSLYTGTQTDRERSRIRQALLNDQTPQLIVASRIGALLPMEPISLVIIAEEQDSNYKQSDPAPRFHARDLLIYRTLTLRIPILLTSVTPSLEAHYNLSQGKYSLLPSHTKQSTVQLASCSIVDVDYERSTQRLKYAQLLSMSLIESIEKTIEEGGKVLVMSSRRGYAPYVVCKKCSKSIRCPHCDVSLTYYQHVAKLTCHYCGYTLDMPPACPHCAASPSLLQIRGYGSERIEEELQTLFPQTSILRIDAETTAGKAKRKAIRHKLESHNSQLYVGTQMLSRLEPIEGIRLIVVPQLDQMLAIPDFRTDEQIFALLYGMAIKYPMAQILLQAKIPSRPIIENLLNASIDEDIIETTASQLLDERQFLGFPPYERLIYLTLKHPEERVAQYAAELCKQLFDTIECFREVSVPIIPYISRIRLQYIRQITLKVRSGYSSQQVRKSLLSAISYIKKQHRLPNNLQTNFDVDPL